MSLFSGLVKTVVSVAVLPVSIVHDVASAIDPDEPSMIKQNLKALGGSVDESVHGVIRGDIFTEDD